jgi:hypothetical protein
MVSRDELQRQCGYGVYLTWYKNNLCNTKTRSIFNPLKKNEMTTTEQKELLNKINIICDNLITEAESLKEMLDICGNHKFRTKLGKVSFLDIINPSNLDVEGFIGLIGMMGRSKDVFGDLPSDVIKVVCVEICGEQLNEKLKNIFG